MNTKKFKLLLNEIRWVPENIVRNDGAHIGEDTLAQHYVSNINNYTSQNGIITFHVNWHRDVNNDEYEYKVTLNQNTMTGEYESIIINDSYRGLIPVWEMYTNSSFIFIRGIWNEFSGRPTNPKNGGVLNQLTGVTTWRENWIFYLSISI